MGNKILAGRYELLARIGDGGMAVVYKATDRLLNRNVAIKILKPEYIKDPKFIDSFRRESQAAAGLSHPNIVSVYDVGKEGNIYYIVMELLDGETLSDIISKEAPLSEKRVISISKQIASALGSAHRKKIIHRDVKPHNILMTEDGTAKIADFGIAKAVNSGTIVSNNSTTVMGSVHYLSPEQAKGGYVDARSDIYSLGIVMYEMLTGRVPFDGENAVTVAMMHMNTDVPAPSIENPAVSPLMDAIVLKATARTPGDRFATAEELVEALENAANNISMASRTDTSIYGLKEFYAVERHPENNDDMAVTSLEDLDLDAPYHEEPASSQVAQTENVEAAGGKKKPLTEEQKKTKRSKIFGVILAIICAIPLSIFILNACSSTGAASVRVPDLKGMTEEEAVAELEKYGLEYKLGTPVLSDEYEAGEVVSTDPEAGEKVKEGYKITIILSRGNTEEIKIPNCVGRKLDDAKEMLKAYELEVGDITYEDSELPEGYIVSQSPDSGETAASGDKVSFVVSNGKGEGETVPNVIGMTEKQAQKALESAGFTLGKVTEEESAEKAGTVISQSVEAETSAEAGTRIDIVLSKGQSEETKQVDIPLTIDYSSAQNEVFKLTVTVTDGNGLHYIVNNQQRIKSDGQETVTLSGTGTGTVRVIMDNEIVYEGNANFETGVLS
jgi:eukaryotic-like serine/threonine-protein kinase